jgi:hypothetical protein
VEHANRELDRNAATHEVVSRETGIAHKAGDGISHKAGDGISHKAGDGIAGFMEQRPTPAG